MQTTRREHLLAWGLALVIFLLPSNLFLQLTLEGAFVRGLLVDYLIPKLYLSDLAVLLLLGVGGLTAKKPSLSALQSWFKRHYNKKNSVMAGIALVTVIGWFVPLPPVHSVWFMSRWVVLFLLALLLLRNSPTWKHPVVLWSCVATILFQTGLGWFQFLTQSELFGYLLLGEPVLSQPVGLSRVVLSGVELVLPYGTTPHPNIWGGILATLCSLVLLLWHSARQKSLPRWLVYPVVTVGLSGVVLSFSLSAAATALAGLLLYVLFKSGKQMTVAHNRVLAIGVSLLLVCVPLLLWLGVQFQPASDSITRRSLLNTAAVYMTLENTLWGVGPNRFTQRVEEYVSTREIARFVQPAHHVPLLVLAELGVLGVALLGLLLYQLDKRVVLLTAFLLCAPLALDHYLYTLAQGQLLLIVTLGLLTTVTKEELTTYGRR